MASVELKNIAFGESIYSLLDIIEPSCDPYKANNEGLTLVDFERILSSIGMTRREYCQTFGVSESTIKRRKKESCLTVDESDKLHRTISLFAEAYKMLAHDANEANAWIRRENHYFHGQTPMEMTRTSVCFNIVLTFIHSKRHSVMA